MSEFFSQTKIENGDVIVTPNQSRDKYRDYVKYKVGKSGYLWGYWNAGRNTKSGFYRDCIAYVGKDFINCPVERISERKLKVCGEYPTENKGV